MAAPCLRDVAPELVGELQRLLVAQGEHGLADQVITLGIVELCPCDDCFCSTFYTVQRSSGAPSSDSRTIALRPQRGILNIDVVGARIVGVEVLYRDDIKTKIRAAMPGANAGGR